MVSYRSGFDAAFKLANEFTYIYNQSSNIGEFRQKMHRHIDVLTNYLENQPFADVSLSLAMVRLIQKNQWETVRLVHDYFRKFQPRLYKACGWESVPFPNESLIEINKTLAEVSVLIELDQALITPEIFRIQHAYFKAKGIQMPVYYALNADILRKAYGLQENEMIGVIAPFRKRNENDRKGCLIEPIQFASHRCPIVFHRCHSELRAYITDSIVDKIIKRIDGDYIFPVQQDFIDQICEIAPEEGSEIVFYRFPSIEEERPETPKLDTEYFSHYKRQFSWETCSIFSIHDLGTIHRLVSKAKIDQSFVVKSCDLRTKERIFEKIPVELSYPCQSLSRLRNHPDSNAILDHLIKKKWIHRSRNLRLSRLLFKYGHLSMVSQYLDPTFITEWKRFRSAPEQIVAEIKSLDFTTSVKSFFEELPEEVKEDVYNKVWLLNGGGNLRTRDNNFGRNNLCKDMHFFYIALREAILRIPRNSETTSEDVEKAIRSLNFSAEISPLFCKLPMDVKEIVYNKIWLLNGGEALRTNDLNYGEHNLFKDMYYFYVALHEAIT